MAITKTWKLQGTSDTTINSTDNIAFSDGTFDNPIQVSLFNDGTHVRSSGGTDTSSSNTPNNVKYISSSTADWGDGTENLSNLEDSEATIKFTIGNDTNIEITDAIIYGFDGITTTEAPTGMTVYLAEKGDTNWTEANGSGNALELGDKTTPSTTHDYFIAMSISPLSVGTKNTDKIQVEFSYQ